MFQIMRAEFHYCEIKPSSNIFLKHLHLCSKEKGQKKVIKKDPNNRDCWQKVRVEKKNPLNLIDDQETENSNHS